MLKTGGQTKVISIYRYKYLRGIKIALAGNPNTGKTTLFNALTGTNQYVGNWPGVTVEKKGGTLKGRGDVEIMDLPGIYSLSPYTLEEVVARNYLVQERPDAILNIIDGTNLERNLYLTTQLMELGIPVVAAVNMMDVVRRNGDKLDTKKLSDTLGCPVVEISAIKGDGVMEAAEQAVNAADSKRAAPPPHRFNGTVEHALAHIEELALHNQPEAQQRWYAIKLFERDVKVIEQLGLTPGIVNHIEGDIKSCEDELDDDAESIITAGRYNWIGSITGKCCQRGSQGRLIVSDKIDQIVTNRILALPVFVAVMGLGYAVSMGGWAISIGTMATGWANNVLFGEWVPGLFDAVLGAAGIAEENVADTFGILYHYSGGVDLLEDSTPLWTMIAADFSAITAYSFMIFNLLCAPCFAAMGAIKREMNSAKWTLGAIGYMCGFAYAAAMIVYQIGGLVTGEAAFSVFTVVAIALLAGLIYQLFRPYKENTGVRLGERSAARA